MTVLGKHQYLLSGNISIEQIHQAIKRQVPETNVRIVDCTGTSNNDSPSTEEEGSNTVIISPYIPSLQPDCIKVKDQKIKELEIAAAKTSTTIQAFYKQQQALFDEFVLLRSKYDDLKLAFNEALWSYSASYHPELNKIPMLDNTFVINENENKYGDYVVTELLGEGQFGSVRSCYLASDSIKNGGKTISGDATLYAIKIIPKHKVNTFNSIRRLSSEINSLQKLKSPFITQFINCIHSQTSLLLITEKGDKDLFEFFNQYSGGINEEWVRDIICNVLHAINYCHGHGICHRDLKPENILLSFDTVSGRCKQLKLCDFGLSSPFQPHVIMSEFCGSPGFFDPDMILEGNYYGDCADLWSVGCVFLEALLGHSQFGELWIPIYGYEVLQQKDLFSSELQAMSKKLIPRLPYTEEALDILFQFLTVDGAARPPLKALSSHKWFQGLVLETIHTRNKALSFIHNADSLIGEISHEMLKNRRAIQRCRHEEENRYNNALTNSDSSTSQIDEDTQRVDPNTNTTAAGNLKNSAGVAPAGLSCFLPPIYLPKTPCVTSAKKLLLSAYDNDDTSDDDDNYYEDSHAVPVSADEAVAGLVSVSQHLELHIPSAVRKV